MRVLALRRCCVSVVRAPVTHQHRPGLYSGVCTVMCVRSSHFCSLPFPRFLPLPIGTLSIFNLKCTNQGCQLPTSSNIENWQRRDNRWRHNARNRTSFVQKKTCEKDVVGIVTFAPDWLSSHQSHYCLYYNGILRFLRKHSMLKFK